MNCFHFSVSLGYNTTDELPIQDINELWIAFIFQYLWDTTQHLYCRNQRSNGCELLSFFSIFGIQHNCSYFYVRIFRVVNCFHFSVSLGYNTTSECCVWSGCMLWIAFIFQYLWDTTQQKFKVWMEFCSCELLSFFSIFGIQHNSFAYRYFSVYVVNCFHFSVSLGYNTTNGGNGGSSIKLWIAFIFQYLWDTTQHTTSAPLAVTRCELLSFFSIFGIQHNCCWLLFFQLCVVNCFHFSVSLGYNTTIVTSMFNSSKLWIAFIFQYLWDTTQLLNSFHKDAACCELLSFFSIFGIQHNEI